MRQKYDINHYREFDINDLRLCFGEKNAMHIAYSYNEKPDKRDWFISTLWKVLGLSYIQKKRVEFKNASRNGGIQ